ncbi:50S ribosomal protein L33 [Candidatus Cytomitobacter primus]|uniref:Large ribosomal subunit protein bL33 n=1 Tax=Candidatus Cytomitobacter primus TaxID=2066024 RepID=A0A5C0UFE5_9PROT|nr:50S ribosomal protein L33 [Candidatus Cytomitobacter primus]QEK38437.1 50S ribosomal protein L33 [Candidatus Cytomitobacter primus]
MAKKNDLGLIALVGDGYFAVRKKTGGMKGLKLELKKYSPKLRKHVIVKEKKLK